MVCLGEGFGASIWDEAGIWGENFSITCLAAQKEKLPISMWDLLLGFVTPKSRLKIPWKHTEFHKFTSAGFSFCRRRKSRTIYFLLSCFSISPFLILSTLHMQSDLALSLSMFFIFRFRVRFLSSSFFFFSHMQIHLFLSQNLGIVQIIFLFRFAPLL